jgi:hypothetical protein
MAKVVNFVGLLGLGALAIASFATMLDFGSATFGFRFETNANLYTAMLLFALFWGSPIALAATKIPATEPPGEQFVPAMATVHRGTVLRQRVALVRPPF